MITIFLNFKNAQKHKSCVGQKKFCTLYMLTSSIKAIYGSMKEPLKGSYDVAKNNIILCIWCNAMCLCGLRFKKHYFPHTVHCCSSMLRLAERHRFLQSSSFWEARCALIGQLSSALWLAEYLKRVTEILHPLPYCDAVSRRDETKTIKPIINEAFVASSGDIITDYNDLYCLFLPWHYHVYICDQRNDKQQALLYTAQNSRLNSQWQIL